MVRFGGIGALAAPLLVGGVLALSGPPAAALDLPPVSLPPISVPGVAVSVPPVSLPPVPVPSTVAVGPLVVTPPAVVSDPNGGLHVQVPLPAPRGADPEAIGIDLGRGETSVSLPPSLGGVQVDPGSPIPTPGGAAVPASRAAGLVRAADVNGSDAPRSSAGHEAPNVPSGAGDSARAGPAAQIVNGDPAGATGSLANSGDGGLWSLLSAAAHSKVAWALLIALAVIARLVAAWAWRDALRRDRSTATVPARPRDRSAPA